MKATADGVFDSITLFFAPSCLAADVSAMMDCYVLKALVNGEVVAEAKLDYLEWVGPFAYKLTVGRTVLVGAELTASFELLPGYQQVRAAGNISIGACLDFRGGVEECHAVQ